MICWPTLITSTTPIRGRQGAGLDDAGVDVDGRRRQPLQRLGQQHVAIELPAGEPERQASLLLAAGEGS